MPPYKNFCPVCLYDGRRPWACTQTRCPIHDMFNQRLQRLQGGAAGVPERAPERKRIL